MLVVPWEGRITGPDALLGIRAVEGFLKILMRAIVVEGAVGAGEAVCIVVRVATTVRMPVDQIDDACDVKVGQSLSP